MEQTLAYKVAFDVGYCVQEGVIEKIEEAIEINQKGTIAC